MFFYYTMNISQVIHIKTTYFYPLSDVLRGSIWPSNKNSLCQTPDETGGDPPQGVATSAEKALE